MAQALNGDDGVMMPAGTVRAARTVDEIRAQADQMVRHQMRRSLDLPLDERAYSTLTPLNRVVGSRWFRWAALGVVLVASAAASYF